MLIKSVYDTWIEYVRDLNMVPHYSSFYLDLFGFFDRNLQNLPDIIMGEIQL